MGGICFSTQQLLRSLAREMSEQRGIKFEYPVNSSIGILTMAVSEKVTLAVVHMHVREETHPCERGNTASKTAVRPPPRNRLNVA